MNQLVSKLSVMSVGPTMAKRFQGRWYPQPMIAPWLTCASDARFYSSSPTENAEDQEPAKSSETSNSDYSLVANKDENVPAELPRENAFPVFAPLRYPGYNVYNLVPSKNNELIADYVLFEDSIQRAQIPWLIYDKLMRNERTIYMAHARAVQKRKLLDEVSRHRSRPPSQGIHRRTRLIIVDNSELGKEANASGKLAYCINTMKHGYRQRHMPHATIGDKIVVAVRGEVKYAYVVGANTHFEYRKHGLPSTDTNNIVLLDKEKNPIGTRVDAPIPAQVLRKRNDVCVAKVVTMASKFI